MVVSNADRPPPRDENRPLGSAINLSRDDRVYHVVIGRRARLSISLSSNLSSIVKWRR